MIHSFAKPILEHWGLSVSDIPTSEKQESDFLVVVESTKVLIEEKAKLDDPKDLLKRTVALESGEVHVASTPITRTNRMSGLVRKAAGQLISSSENDHDFRVVWFTGTGLSSEAQAKQFEASIYGTTNIIEKGKWDLTPCYFYRNSDFHRYAEAIDGAVVANTAHGKVNMKLCLNSLSPNYPSFRTSPFAQLFLPAVVDPRTLEIEGAAYIADTPLDRNNEQGLLQFLQNRYATGLLMAIDMGHTVATVAVPDDDS